MKRFPGVWSVFVLVLLACAGVVSAQQPPAQPGVEVDPLQCWWRTSAGAVRMGEPFSVVLTCSVVETDAVKVVPDRSPLEPTAIQLPPFEVLGGTRHADLQADGRRFFQYDYRLRIINEDFFGRDAAVPEVKIAYRIQSQVNGAAIEGMEKSYIMPALSVRVLSLVPAAAADIRDSTDSTFGDIEDRLFRANLLVTLGGLLAALGALVAIVGLVRAATRLRGHRPAAHGVVGDAAIVGALRTEIARISRERDAGGWTPALAARLLTMLRVAAGLMLSKTVGYTIASEGVEGQPGHLVLRGGWSRAKRLSVSGSITPPDVSREISALAATSSVPADRLSLLEALQGALARLTAGQYGRQPWHDDGLDEALDVGRRVTNRIRVDRLWPVRTFKAASRATVDLGQRVWSR